MEDLSVVQGGTLLFCANATLNATTTSPGAAGSAADIGAARSGILIMTFDADTAANITDLDIFTFQTNVGGDTFVEAHPHALITAVAGSTQGGTRTVVTSIADILFAGGNQVLMYFYKNCLKRYIYLSWTCGATTEFFSASFIPTDSVHAKFYDSTPTLRKV